MIPIKSIVLQTIEKRANQLLYKNYKKYFHKKYEIQIIENVMCNDPCHFVAVFKDYLIADDHSEYLRRIYKKHESTQRLVKLFAYYQETSVIFPNYTPLIESKYLYNNVIRKQRVIDEQQNLEEYKKYLINKEKKKNKKSSPLKAIENFFEENTDEEEISRVFNSKAYYDILNTSESVKRIVFGIEENKNKNKDIMKYISKDNGQMNESDSIKDLVTKIDKMEGIKEKNKEMNYINNVKKKLKYAAKLLSKKSTNTNGNTNNNNKSLPKEKNKNSKLKKADKKGHSSSFKKNKTININININNTKNNIAMTDRTLMANNNSHNIINTNFPINNKEVFKEKRIIFNQKKIQSTLPYQLFRSSNIISNLNKKNCNNNNINNNSINGLQQKLMEIFNKKLKKNKNNNRNNSYNLSLSKTSNTSRLRTKNKAFIINTIQNTILHSKSKRNHSINIKSDKHIHITNPNEKRHSVSKNNKKNNDNINYNCHRRIKSQINNNININNIGNDKALNTKKNFKNYYSINKPILTISPSLKKRNIFGFKTMSKLTETIYDYKSNKIYNRNSEYNIKHNYASHNNSLKNKNIIKKHANPINNNILSYKSKYNNNKNYYYSKNNDIKYKK